MRDVLCLHLGASGSEAHVLRRSPARNACAQHSCIIEQHRDSDLLRVRCVSRADVDLKSPDAFSCCCTCTRWIRAAQPCDRLAAHRGVNRNTFQLAIIVSVLRIVCVHSFMLNVFGWSCSARLYPGGCSASHGALFIVPRWLKLTVPKPLLVFIKSSVLVLLTPCNGLCEFGSV